MRQEILFHSRCICVKSHLIGLSKPINFCKFAANQHTVSLLLNTDWFNKSIDKPSDWLPDEGYFI